MDVREQIKRWIQPAVQSMSAYHVPASAGLIKLDAMENPYSWPREIKQAWLAELAGAEINRYPDAEAKVLKDRIRAVFSVPEGAQLLLGNGSDEIIQILTLSMAKPGLVIMAPEPSFAMYRLAAQITGAEFVGVPLKEDDFSLDAEALLAAIKTHQPAIVFLAWPNNPTGNIFDETVVTQVIEKSPGVVVLDEAYHVFAQKSFMPLLDKYENLLIMRTLSKLGLAGLRLGFLAGHPAWLGEFEKLRMPYNTGVLNQSSVAFILQHVDVLHDQARKIRQDRDILYQQLSALAAVKVWPSAANFLLLRIENASAAAVHEQLKAQGILAIGTEAENRALMQALPSCL